MDQRSLSLLETLGLVDICVVFLLGLGKHLVPQPRVSTGHTLPLAKTCALSS